MDDDTYRSLDVKFKKWDVMLKIVAPLVTVGGLLLGVYQVNRERDETYRREFKRHVWEKQTEVYMRMGDVVGKIADGNKDKDQWRRDIHEYNSLYYGVTNYVEDKPVEEAMKKLFVSIRELDKNPDNEGNADAVKLLAIQLGETCREANNKFWFEESQGSK